MYDGPRIDTALRVVSNRCIIDVFICESEDLSLYIEKDEFLHIIYTCLKRCKVSNEIQYVSLIVVLTDGITPDTLSKFYHTPLGRFSFYLNRNLGYLTGSVVLFTEVHPNRKSFLRSLFHELDHVSWVLSGKKVNKNIAYILQPHEIRARLVSRYLSRRFRK